MEENGHKKSYRVPKLDKKGEIHYLVQRFAEVNEGEEVVLEYKRKGLKGYIELIRVKNVEQTEVEDEDNEIPIINEDEQTTDGPDFSMESEE